MRILLDECVPRPLRRELPGHDVHTVPEMGWAGKKNGELLQLMGPHRFEVFLTVDQNLRYQQNLRAVGVAVIVLVAATNRMADLVALIAKDEEEGLTSQEFAAWLEYQAMVERERGWWRTVGELQRFVLPRPGPA